MRISARRDQGSYRDGLQVRSEGPLGVPALPALPYPSHWEGTQGADEVLCENSRGFGPPHPSLPACGETGRRSGLLGNCVQQHREVPALAPTPTRAKACPGRPFPR